MASRRAVAMSGLALGRYAARGVREGESRACEQHRECGAPRAEACACAHSTRTPRRGQHGRARTHLACGAEQGAEGGVEDVHEGLKLGGAQVDVGLEILDDTCSNDATRRVICRETLC